MRRLPLVGLLFVCIALPMVAQEVDFGNVQLTRTRDSSFSVTNTLPLPITINAIKMRGRPSDYSVVSGGAPVTVQPNATHSIIIRFAPSMLGQRIDTMIVDGNFPGAPVEVILKGNGVPLPVELSAFSAVWTPSGVALSWRTESERNNTGFHVQREQAGRFEDIGFVLGNGTRSFRTDYSFIDKGPFETGGTAAYRLLQVDADGTTELSQVLRIATGDAARPSLRLSVLPHPVSDRAMLGLTLPEAASVSIDVLDISGRPCGASARSDHAAGSHLLPLHLGHLSPGIYFIHLTAGDHRAVASVLVKR